MTRNSRITSGLAAGLLWTCSGTIRADNPLKTYVQSPDSSFTWKQTERKRSGGATVFHLEFISQTWRGQFWSHHLQVVRPSAVRNPGMAFLYVTGDGQGEGDIPMLKTLAERAGTLAAVLTEVPNQPLYHGRREDALIAYTLDQYLRTGDDTWPLLFPMVKSAVRAMDVVQAFAREEFKQEIGEFVVSGASKRGWTTWLTAACDSRVKGIAPMVIDMLNMKAQLHWTEKVYGRQSEQIHDYTELDLHQKLDDPPMQRLRSWIDPYAFREHYTMPKLLLLGTNDPYWTVDSLQHYWNELPEPKLVFQTPNAGHDLAGGKQAIETLAAWFQMIADGQPLPKLEWQVQIHSQSADLSATWDRPVKRARLWTAESTDRDFRNERWNARDLDLGSGSSRLTAEIPKPANGFRAFLAEIELESGAGHAFKLSTEARVIPNLP
jgi:PhoPQ-activated pathogenicity-related protein